MKKIFLSAIIALFIGVSASAQSTVDSIAAKYKLLPMPAPLTIEKTFPVLGTYQLSTDAAVANTTTATTNSTTTNSTTATNSSSSVGTTNSTATTDQAATTSTDASAVATPSITITLDSASKGIVWVEGLPEGKFKAYLKKSPTTYRIISQKTNMGKQIPEGTLYFDQETNALHIAMGKAYNDEDPIGIFGLNAPATDVSTSTDVAVAPKSKSTKSKSKVTFYTASKLVTEPAAQEAQGGGINQQNQQ